MGIGLATAFAAALCYGVGSVLQAMAARETATVEGLDPRVVIRLLRSWRYVLGVGLDGVGFLLALVAVRTLPLFVVQSVVASFLAITAVLGALVLGMPLGRRDRAGIAVVVVGLVLVGSSATEDAQVDVTKAETWGVLAATLVLVTLAIPAARLSGPRGATALGAVAGLAFGSTAVATRMLPDDLVDLVESPAAWALVIAGATALLTYSIALQRGSVTRATAPVVVGETVAPAVVGLVLLGDHTRPGWGLVATVGFVLAVAGAVSLAGHGEVEDVRT
jgi:drug/metabolite transporter (DMT)-like permease